MASYLRSWIYGTQAEPSTPGPFIQTNGTTENISQAPDIEVIEPQEEEENDSDDGYDTDKPPAFPALNSPQRAVSSTSKAQATTVSRSNGLMAPPPPRLAAPSLGVPSTGANRGASNSLDPLATKGKPGRKARFVPLAPGHSMLDWANLKSSGKDLRGGVTTLLRVTPSMLKEHNKKDDAWTCIAGKVYNMTPYIPFHPGGEKELMRVAGRDGTKLFAYTHAWVSAEMMMDACMVGLLVPE